MTELLKIENLWKRYNLKTVLQDLSATISEGKLLVLLVIMVAEKRHY